MRAGKKRNKPAVFLAIMFVLISLTGLTLYMLSFDYKRNAEDDFGSIPSLRSALTVTADDTSPNGSVVLRANFNITNVGKNRVTLLDTLAIEPLYELRLQKRLPDGNFEAVPMRANSFKPTIADKTGDSEDQVAFSYERDAEVLLLPGRSLSVHLPLSAYELKDASGAYSLSLNYRLDALLALSTPAERERLTIRPMSIRSQIEFELPLKK